MTLPDPSAAARLLIVDDEPDLCALYEMTLRREGYAVDTAGSVTAAWSRLQAARYDLLITDMRLPDGLGLDLLQRLQRDGRQEKTMVITAYGSPQNAVEVLRAGAYDYLTKPVDLKDLRRIVRGALTGVPPASAPSSTAGAATTPATSPSVTAAAPALRSQPRPAAPAPSTAAARPATAPVQPGGDALDSQGLPLQDDWLGPRDDPPELRHMVGDSTSMRQVRARMAKVARSMAPVLIHGESGTGKELVARGIHQLSDRRAGPFIAVNCGAIPENLLEAEFFGYRKGAFTGAQQDRGGFFQAARDGTLFLDEIGELPLSMQSKLLRAIQERKVRPLGDTQETWVDVRIVSATHRTLGQEVIEGRFRQDLYYRLNVIDIIVPPLRERRDDIPLLARALLTRIAGETGSNGEDMPTLSPGAIAALQAHSFEGNVRELENCLQRALALRSGAVITEFDLGLDLPDSEPASPPLSPQPPPPAASAPVSAPAPVARSPDDALPVDLPTDLQAYLDDIERQVLRRALQVYGMNRTAAGQHLGLSLRQMRYRMSRLGLDADSVLAQDRPPQEWRNGWWTPARAIPSPNFGPRPAGGQIDLAVIHSISLPPGEYGGPYIAQLFTNQLNPDAHPYFGPLRNLQVSAHFVIRRDGQALQFVSVNDRAWHAGASHWQGRDNCNDHSIGIEMEGLEGELFEPVQYEVLVRLLLAINRQWPLESLAGHEHIAPGRKLDPGPGFDWHGLHQALGWEVRRFASLAPARAPLAGA
ncbi:1,6-anhydro-N-acetylmuramyl-L-alanine amidase AmpD [Amphibiibacter pelophylacis]|uniref:1,6-anhydro-N-acetylmuramyl-L-alanine amidase AmpD n=1 Tax=Amphibiibacter pelophylacis TaxID=1799477 RepID=A0ACC6P3Y4_9BURK